MPACHGEGYLSARNYVMNAGDWLDNKAGLSKPANVYYSNTDASLSKNFVFKERQRPRFRLEGFNFINHPNYTFGADRNLNLVFDATGKQTNAMFGTATSKPGHHIIQLAVRHYCNRLLFASCPFTMMTFLHPFLAISETVS